MLIWLLACTGNPADSETKDTGTEEKIPSSYQVIWSTDPNPLVAGAEGQFTETVTDQDGNPIDDLQQVHQRMVHTIFISKNLADFHHVHQEDFTPVTADDLRSATFHLPVTLQFSGDYGLGFDYAHRNQYLHTESALAVNGSPEQGEADLTVSTSASDRDVKVDLTWDTAPMAGFESAWTVTLSDASSGAPITDLVQWLGADAHCVMTDVELASIDHTHAWFPGMENAPPGHDMPHQYPGPTIPFHYTFQTAGFHKMWVQFAREGAPDSAYTVPFVFEVSP